ncbi:MAG: HAD family hydrolase [Alphaproteobacteria bacterium]|nr:HAD family hydrolase [Alphaproteobacteria bacterium]
MAHIYNPERPYHHKYPIKAVGFDNDNTLYQEPWHAKELHQLAALCAIVPQMEETTVWEIKKLMARSQREYGGSLNIFANDYGMDLGELRQAHYRKLIEKTKGKNFFRRPENLVRGMQALKDNSVSTFIATHGNLEWTRHSLQDEGQKGRDLTDFFNEQNIICKDQIPGCIGKNKSPAMYDEMIKRLEGPKQNILGSSNRGRCWAMVDDTPDNLKFAKALGMLTILVDTKGSDPKKLPPYVDVVVKDATEAIQVIIKSNEYHERNIRQNRLALPYFPEAEEGNPENLEALEV